MILEITINLIEKAEPQLAILPLLPAIAVGILSGLASIGLIVTGSIIYDKFAGKSICILGPESSGKTQLLSFLRNEPYPYEERHHSQYVEYEEFTTEIGEKKIKIKKGVDLGGEEARIETYYSKLISESDCIFFTFDVNKYINDKIYQKKEVNSRLYFIYRKKNNKPTVVFGSHLDELSKEERKSIIKTIQKEVKEEEYKELLKKNFFVTDLRDTDQLKECINKVIL